jgi:hypothetical protein
MTGHALIARHGMFGFTKETWGKIAVSVDPSTVLRIWFFSFE